MSAEVHGEIEVQMSVSYPDGTSIEVRMLRPSDESEEVLRNSGGAMVADVGIDHVPPMVAAVSSAVARLAGAVV